ncbi:MAG: glycoside hydrolase family protein [Lachnospiraceae bacterium]|nr:glycoside hydrolase family protein [Lachnospiraceae bacterium]
MDMVENILTNNPCFRSGKKIRVKGLMLHSVGCPQPSAEVFVRRWNRQDASRACVHAFIDGNSGKVYQTLPWNHRGWHGGGSSNNTHIGVEMCEPACIKYIGGASFTCSDRESALAVVRRTYDAAVELFAFLCREFSLDPLADGVIVSHKEGHARGIASGHGDPDHLWKGLQSGHTMDGFRRDVSAALARDAQAAPAAPMPSPAAPASSSSASMPSPSVPMPSPSVPMPSPSVPIPSPSASIPSPSTPMSSPAAPSPGQTPGPASAQSTIPPCAPAGKMHISHRGTELIARYEGCRLEAYLCPAGKWTIGYGHTRDVKPGDRLGSQEAALELLKKDLEKYENYVNEFAAQGILSFPLNQNQFDALTSFCYNCGKGNLQKLVSGRDAATVGQKMLLYNKSGGKVLAGLVRRRKEESALFLS